MGSAYARVFPLPVGAETHRSRGGLYGTYNDLAKLEFSGNRYDKIAVWTTDENSAYRLHSKAKVMEPEKSSFIPSSASLFRVLRLKPDASVLADESSGTAVDELMSLAPMIA